MLKRQRKVSLSFFNSKTLNTILIILSFCIFSSSVNSKIFDFTNNPQEILVIDNGKEAFFHRYQLIKEAKKSINIEYFIFNMKGDSTQIILRELVKKAKQGVSVRILLDNFYYNFTPALSNSLISSGIKIKKYNPAFLMTVMAQHRNHRKLFSIDGKKAVIGGRNISDEYFDIGSTFNFHDRDLLIVGESVKSMDDTFNDYWLHELSKTIKYQKPPRKFRSGGPRQSNSSRFSAQKYKRWKRAINNAQNYLYKDNTQLNSVLVDLLKQGQTSFSQNKSFICDDSRFISDDAGKIGSKFKDSAVYLYDKIINVQKTLTIETPYFVPKEREYEIFQKILEDGVDVSLLTNGVNGTDAALISILFLDRVKFFVQRGMNAFIHGGRNIFNANDERLWALHNKTFVFDQEDVIIGSYNLDPRSQRFNSEMLYECINNQSLVAVMEKKFQYNASRSIPINKEGEPMFPEDDSLRYHVKVFGSRILKHLLKFFDFLL